MSNLCQEVQEKLATEVKLTDHDNQHLFTCKKCQSTFADYQALVSLIDTDASEIKVPDHFLDNVMNEISELSHENDWFEITISKLKSWSKIPVIEYSYLFSGFCFGVFSFIRFVAFIFIPA